MKTFVKTGITAALAFGLATFGTTQARAGGWAVAGGVIGGLAAGTVIGATIANASAPVYYNYPAPYPTPVYNSYPAPVYSAPAPAVVIAAPPVVYPRPWVYGPRFVHYPYGRFGYWGPRYYRRW